MPAPVHFKYRAFLSYAHADVGWGKRLHSQLEAFRIDDDLAGSDTPRGTVPKTLRPIFRDREDFAGGHSLTNATIAALDASAALIVLCSTVAATRPAVNEEVRLFRWRHPERPVIPVIIDGIWPDNFPPALRFEIEPDGSVSDRPVTILGPDLRETVDGRHLGVAKIVAGLVGVGTDEIVRRAERDRQRRLRNWIAGLSVIVVALAGLAVWAEINRREAVAQRAVAEERRQEAERNFTLAKGAADGLVFDIARGLRSVEGVRAETVDKILGTARATFDKLTDAAPDNPELQRSRSVMLDEFGETYQIQGNLAKALESYRESLRLREALANLGIGNDPSQSRRIQRDLAVSHGRVGAVLRAQGNLPDALLSYHASLLISNRLAEADPENTEGQRDVSVMLEHIGDVQRAQGNLALALESFRASLAYSERIAKADPTNWEKQRDHSYSHSSMGDALFAQGAREEALESYRTSLAIRERLTRANPANTSWQRDHAVAHSRIGDVLIAQENWAQALESFRASNSIRERLTMADPGNHQWHSDLAASRMKIGDALIALGDLTEALLSYRAALSIDERLAGADPANVEWQRNLSISHDKIGDVLVKQGYLQAALESYRVSLAISERLAKIDTSNAGWQHDLSDSHVMVGDVLRAQGNLSAALESYRASLAIREHSAKIDPTNAGWHRDLALSYGRVGGVDAQQGERQRALAAFERGREIIAHLLVASPSNATLTKDLSWFDQEIARLKE